MDNSAQAPNEENAESENVGTQLLFENEQIRVWDLSLAPGESVATHRHRTDFCLIVSKGGHLQHANPNDANDKHDVSFADNQVVYVPVGADGALHQRLTNVGDAPYQNYVIEFKTQK